MNIRFWKQFNTLLMQLLDMFNKNKVLFNNNNIDHIYFIKQNILRHRNVCSNTFEKIKPYRQKYKYKQK